MKMQSYREEFERLSKGVAMRLERVKVYEGKVPAIETDLALEEIRRLYDLLLQMREQGLQIDHLPAPDKLVGSFEETVKQTVEEVAPPPVEEVPVKVAEEVAAPPVEKAPAKVIEEVAAPPVEKPPVVEEEPTKQVEVPVIESAIKPVKGASSILADKLKRTDHKSINDLIASGRSDQSISKRMQHNPISDLKNSIGINEKFIFVYELFGGNANLYATTIDRLNGMSGREEAIALMETLREEYRWDIENMAFQKLVDMVVRRYSA